MRLFYALVIAAAAGLPLSAQVQSPGHTAGIIATLSPLV